MSGQNDTESRSAAKSEALADLVAILDLERLERNLFRGRSPKTGWQRVFGGQVIGQALVAACRTVEGRRPHSLHAYFLLPGAPDIPIIYEVDRLRDGRSFTTRRVTAIQNGQPIFMMAASFQIDEPGFDHAADMPDVPMPEELAGTGNFAPDVLARMPETVRRYFERERPIDLRPVEFERYDGTPREPRFHVWMKTKERLPDDPVIHNCVLAYASDLTLLDSSLIAHGRTVFDRAIRAASLDHALWLHRPFRADEWLLYAQDSPNASGARGFSRGAIYTRDGRLVASVAQEGLVRDAGREG
jgi:acyl-CoA thioesterase-2